MLQLITLLAALNAPAEPASNKASVEGNLDKSQIRDVVRSNISDIRRCYNDGLRDDPNLAGRLAVHFKIAASGKVTDSELQSSDLEHAGVETCIVKAVAKWSFPQPEGGGSVLVTYPFVLSPG